MVALWLIVSAALFLFLSLSPSTSNLTPNSFGLWSCSSSWPFSESRPPYLATKSKSSLHLFFMVVSSPLKTPFSIFRRLFSSMRELYSDEEDVEEDLSSDWSSCAAMPWPPPAFECCLFAHAFLRRISHRPSFSPFRNFSLQNSHRLVATLRNP